MENFGFLQRLPYGGDTHDPLESENRDTFQAVSTYEADIDHSDVGIGLRLQLAKVPGPFKDVDLNFD
jgi:hypothetical protein